MSVTSVAFGSIFVLSSADAEEGASQYTLDEVYSISRLYELT